MTELEACQSGHCSVRGFMCKPENLDKTRKILFIDCV